MTQARFITFIFLTALVCVSALYFTQAVREAEIKEFWGDETHGLELLDRTSFFTLLMRGMPGQGSPSPLDYLILKVIHNLSQPIHFLGLAPEIYYRIAPIFFYLCAAGTIGILFITSQRKKDPGRIFYLQAFLVIMAVVSFYTPFYNFYYSIETRPYSLWNSLWLVIVALYLLYQDFNLPTCILMVLLAMTATASFYQLGCLALSFFVVELCLGQKFSATVRKLLNVFAVPLGVCLYYIFIRQMKWDNMHPAENIIGFFDWWPTKILVPILSVIGALLASSTKNYQRHSIVFLSMLILYVISPLLNDITISRGFHFSHRQYLYYDLIYPALIMHVALAWPEYIPMIKNWRKANSFLIAKFAVIVILTGYSTFNIFKGYEQFKLGKLNYYRPQSYSDLISEFTGEGTLTRARWKNYLFYYQLVAKYFPKSKEVYGLQGYIYSHLGQEREAVAAYDKAIALTPQFFWYSYNLAVLKYGAGEYNQAVKLLEAATQFNPRGTLLMIRKSIKIYVPIVAQYVGRTQITPAMQYRQGVRNAHILLVWAYLKEQQYARAAEIIRLAPPLDQNDEKYFSDLEKLVVLKQKTPGKENVKVLSKLEAIEAALAKRAEGIRLEMY